MKTKINALLLIAFFAVAGILSSCGEPAKSDEADTVSAENEFEIKEGTYQKKNSEEKIIIIDQSHLQLSDMDFQALIDRYKIAYSEFGWEPNENTINEIQEPRSYESYDFGDKKSIYMNLFENWDSSPEIEYFDTDGYSLVYLKEEYFLIDSEEE